MSASARLLWALGITNGLQSGRQVSQCRQEDRRCWPHTLLLISAWNQCSCSPLNWTSLPQILFCAVQTGAPTLPNNLLPFVSCIIMACCAGGMIASKKELPPFPTRTNLIPRHISPPHWASHPKLLFFASGRLPFGTESVAATQDRQTNEDLLAAQLLKSGDSMRINSPAERAAVKRQISTLSCSLLGPSIAAHVNL